MRLPLRTTFENRDYAYTLLTKNIAPDTASFQISLEGQTYTLVRGHEKGWHTLEETIDHPAGLLQAIAKNIALRYRL